MDQQALWQIRVMLHKEGITTKMAAEHLCFSSNWLNKKLRGAAKWTLEDERRLRELVEITRERRLQASREALERMRRLDRGAEGTERRA